MPFDNPARGFYRGRVKVLFIGDVVGRPGRRAVRELLPWLRQRHGLQVVIANAENAAGGSGITPETAWLFAQAFGTSPEFWVNLQANYDLARNQPKRNVRRLAMAG